ncbi:hypothetical protein RI129_008887 [Pyrocoelia pectoralis]|uniref:DUF4806 domain-containing protein n=1 Tax=Pyrocoelia pectoralis TaxID=417401 RepID=A0AAN7V6D3_9COLE
MEKTWTIVKFVEDDSVQAVPANWIENSKCFWPSYPNDRLIQAIKRCEPHNVSWPLYEVKVFRNSSYSDYQVARQKEKRAEIESDLNTDNEGESKKKRKRFQKIYSSDEEEEISSVLSTPPQLVKRTSKQQKEINGSETPASVTSVNDNHMSGYTQVDKSTLNMGGKNINDVFIEYFRQIIRKQHLIQATLMQMMEDINELKSRTSIGLDNTIVQKTSIFTLYDFPIPNEPALQELENHLSKEDNLNDMIDEVSKIGGNNISEFVKRAMSRLISNEVGSEYSWMGLKQKKIFSKLIVVQVIIRAGLRIFKNETSKSFEDAMKNWLRRSKERLDKQKK